MRKLLLIQLAVFIVSMAMAQQKPNIIWLMAEDMSLDLACYGMPVVKTPILDMMASEGVKFENAFVTNPICSPSRSAMMVGTHQLKINAHNHRSNRNVPLHKDYKPFTYWLREAGYTCILGHEKVMGYGQKTDLNYKHEKLGEWDGVNNFGLFDKLNGFEKEDEPFFAQIQLKVTHRGDWWNEVREASEHPVNPADVVMPKYYADHPAIRLDWAKYLDQVEYMDNEIGIILKDLENKGMAENTIVIFIGDNGRCNIRGKGYLHDAGLRIPLIIYNPLNPSPGKVSKQVVSATDITATILDYAGIGIPEYMTGKPIFNNNMDRKYVYSARDLWDEIEEKMRSISSDEWKYIRNDKPEIPYDAHQGYLEFYRPAVHVMRALNEQGKLNEAQQFFFQPSKPKEELYNLKNDSEELHNLANDPKYSSQLKKMQKVLTEYDLEMAPVSNVYQPMPVNSYKVVEWVKQNKPELYQRMLNGEEIGYKKMTQQYKLAQTKDKK